MKKYFIYLLLMMFSSMGAQAQKSYFKEALEKLVSNKAFTMNQSGAKNEVGDTAQWSWKKYRFKTLKKDKFLKELDRINKAFQKDCNQPVTDFYYMVDGNNNPLKTWMNFDISVGNDLIMVGNFSAYSVLINRQQMGHSGMRRVCAIEWGHIIENGLVNEKGYEGNISIVEGKAPLNKHHVADEVKQQTYKATQYTGVLTPIDTQEEKAAPKEKTKEEKEEVPNEQLTKMLKDAQTNLKGNFEIIGKRDPELWDRGYFICYKDETDMYVEPILVATNGTNFSYKHDLKDITMGRVRALMKDGTICSEWIDIPFVPGEIAELSVHNGYYSLTGSSFYKQWVEEKSKNHDGWDECKYTAYALSNIHSPGIICYLFYQHLIKDSSNQKKIFKALPTTLQENHVGRFIKKHMNNKL